MTVDCRRVLQECDFPEEDARWVELLLRRHTTGQIIAAVWRHDPAGDHGFEWFRKLFGSAIPAVRELRYGETEEFWSAYDWASGAFRELTPFDLEIVQVMSADPRRMKVAYAKSSVKRPAYVMKVFHDTVLGPAPERAPDVDLTPKGVVTRGLGR